MKCIAIATAITVAFAAPAFAQAAAFNGGNTGFNTGTPNSELAVLGSMYGGFYSGTYRATYVYGSDGKLKSVSASGRRTSVMMDRGKAGTPYSRALDRNREAAKHGNGVPHIQTSTIGYVGNSAYNRKTGQRIGRKGGAL